MHARERVIHLSIHIIEKKKFQEERKRSSQGYICTVSFVQFFFPKKIDK